MADKIDLTPAIDRIREEIARMEAARETATTKRLEGIHDRTADQGWFHG